MNTINSLSDPRAAAAVVVYIRARTTKILQGWNEGQILVEALRAAGRKGFFAVLENGLVKGVLILDVINGGMYIKAIAADGKTERAALVAAAYESWKNNVPDIIYAFRHGKTAPNVIKHPLKFVHKAISYGRRLPS